MHFILNRLSSFKAYFIAIVLSLLFLQLTAQQPQYSYSVNSARPLPSFIPMAGSQVNNNTNLRSQWLYFPDDFRTTFPTNKDISSIYFKVSRVQNTDLIDLMVALKQDTLTTLDSNTWVTALDTVKFDSTFLIRNLVANDWIKIELDNPFPYNPNLPLIVEVDQSRVNGGVYLEASGVPFNPSNANAITQIYGPHQSSTVSGTGSSYSFGFDLIDGKVSDDVGVLAIDSPAVYCKDGVYDVYASIKNFGTNQVDSVDIFWEVEGRLEGHIKHRNLLDTVNGSSPSTATVFLGTYYFDKALEVKVYTHQPNGVSDNKNANDTLIRVVRPSLSGNYTVNKTGLANDSNFTSLTSMAGWLNEVGVCGPTVIDVFAGTYNEFVHFKEIPGASAINHVLIRGKDSSMITVTHDGSSSRSTLVFEETKHLRVHGMSFIYTGMQGGRAVSFVNAENDTLSNSVVQVSTDNPPMDLYGIFFGGSTASASAGSNHNILIENSKVTGGYIGLRMAGLSTAFSINNKIYNNQIDSASSLGISASSQDSLDIVGNSINAVDFIGTEGVKITNASNVHLKQNSIQANQRALEISNQSLYASVERGNVIENNMVVGGGSSVNSAVFLYGVNAVSFWHNSIYAKGQASGISIGNSGMQIGDYDIRNNIFTAENGFAFTRQTGAIVDTALYGKMNYNIYHKYNDNGRALLRVNGEEYINLMEYQRAIPTLNINSLQGNPHFKSIAVPADLHIIGSYPDEKGDNSVGVTIDIDNESRPSAHATYVDIGADEFFPAACTSPIVKLDSIEKSSVIAYFTKSDVGNTIEYTLVRCGVNPSNVNLISTTSDSVKFSGLQTEACYNLYVREVCAVGDTSLWSGPHSFLTKDIPYYAVYEINGVDNLSGIADSIGVDAWTSGIVVGENLHPTNGLSFTLVDMATTKQEGIHVYSNNSFQIEEGDSLMLRGEVKQNFGLTEFHIDSLFKISNSTLPTPIQTDTLGEFTESKLIEIKDFVLLDSSQTGTYEMRAHNGSDTITILISEFTEVSDSLDLVSNSWNVGDTICSLIGIGGQYDTAAIAPYLKGYHVIPMHYEQLEVCQLSTAVEKNQFIESKLIIYPNPTKGEFVLSGIGWSENTVQLTIRDINGRIVLEDEVNPNKGDFKKHYNLKTQAKGIYFIQIVDKNRIITQKMILD